MSAAIHNPPPTTPPVAGPPPVQRDPVFPQFAAWLSRTANNPQVQLFVAGAALVLLGALVVTNSVWTLPLLIGGGVMLLVVFVGPRLDGRFLVEFGEHGTGIELKARVRPQTEQAAATVTSTAVTKPVLVNAPLPVPVPAPAPAAVPEAVVVDGEAHTVEIDVAELKALIAVAERAEAPVRAAA